jgi:hypothetical protein
MRGKIKRVKGKIGSEGKYFSDGNQNRIIYVFIG